jgi:hypothetical protein
MNGMEKNGILDDGLYLSATCVFFFFYRSEVFLLFEYTVCVLCGLSKWQCSLLLDLELFYFIF